MSSFGKVAVSIVCELLIVRDVCTVASEGGTLSEEEDGCGQWAVNSAELETRMKFANHPSLLVEQI